MDTIIIRSTIVVGFLAVAFWVVALGGVAAITHMCNSDYKPALCVVTAAVGGVEAVLGPG